MSREEAIGRFVEQIKRIIDDAEMKYHKLGAVKDLAEQMKFKAQENAIEQEMEAYSWFRYRLASTLDDYNSNLKKNDNREGKQQS